MSLCCFPCFQGSGHKKAQSERCFCCWRNWCRRHHLTSNEDVTQELTDGFTYARNLYKGPERQARKTIHCGSEMRAQSSQENIIKVLDQGPHSTPYRFRVQVQQADNPVQCWSECSAELTFNLREASRMRALQEGCLEKVAASTVPAFPAGNIPHICSFMPVHPAFSRAQWFLDELFTRSCAPSVRSDVIRVFTAYGDKGPYNDQGDTPEDQVKKAIASVMGTWPDRLQYFGQPLHFPWFTLEQAFVRGKHPASHLLHRVPTVWVELEHLEPTGAELEEPPPELQRTPEPEEGTAPGLEPGPAVPVLEPVSPPSAPPHLEQPPTSPAAPGPALEVEPPGPPALMRIPRAKAAPAPAGDYPQAVTNKRLLREAKYSIRLFPPRLVAEQLTAMDAELFTEVLPSQCLGSIWSHWENPANEQLEPTARATMAQFNRVATCVMTTCLGDPSMMSQDRAKVIEYWIKVAKECRTLGNFSSLHAILSGLESTPVHRLKKTWKEVSRRSRVQMKKLCEEDNPEIWRKLMKKRPSRFVTLMLTLCGAQKRLQKKCVPFLGKFLDELMMLDTDIENSLEGNRMNLEKEKMKIMEEIVVLQEAAEKYEIEPDEQFWAWFRAAEQLSLRQSYLLSRKLERL